jgi:hypothetical protein
MKKTFLIALVLAASLGSGAQPQKAKGAQRKVVITQPAAYPNVAGEPASIADPTVDQTSPAPLPPEIKMNIKRRRKVRIVPAPPPPGPIAPVAPRREAPLN